MSVQVNLKVKIARALCHPAVGRLLSQVLGDRIPSRGCIIDTRCELINPEIKALLFWRLYESAEIRFINQYLRRDLDVVELGGSLGVVTCQIRKRIDPRSKIVCVEANPDLADQIRLNLNLNALDEKVFIEKKAVDYGPSNRATVAFARGESNIAGKITTREDEKDSLSIGTTTLLKIIDEHQIRDYALVSDIEGAEAGIVIEDKEALRRCRQIIIELHPTTFNGLEIGVDQMCETFSVVHGFQLRDRYGPVCVFEK